MQTATKSLNKEHYYLLRCLQLAQKGLGTTYPNPLVGSIVVYKDKIIGEGFHYQSGKEHAEVLAINSVAHKELLKDSTLYVNLEPCNHKGKTPACTHYIVENQIKKVVIAGFDYNPKVYQKGLQMLQENKVEVIHEPKLTKLNNFLNRRFFTFHTQKRPYIILKWAQSHDGFIDGLEKEPVSISNALSKQLSHKWRTEEQAILIGKNTALKDNPSLDPRLWKGKDNIKIIIDRKLEIPPHAHLFSKNNVVIINEIKNEKTSNIEWVRFNFQNPILPQLMEELYQRNIISVLVEGGRSTIESFIKAQLWDEARVFGSPKIIKKGVPAPSFSYKLHSSQPLQSDVLKTYYNGQNIFL